MNYIAEVDNIINAVNDKLKIHLSKKYPEIIYNAMNYSVFAGGKRIRPVLMVGACKALGGDYTQCIDFACAVEFIHTYSLIHDDLPAMDNDDLRRGKPTCHKKFNEAIAILAGDALLNLSFEIMSNIVFEKFERKYAEAMKILSNASGINGMIGGQVVDIDSENKQVDKETLNYIHKNKTAALITASLKCGAVLAGAPKEQIDIFEKVGLNLGIAFQIKDDILDITSTEDILGKPVFSDEKNNKTTYVSLYGMEKAQEDYKMLSDTSAEMLKSFGENGRFLLEYTNNLFDRIR